MAATIADLYQRRVREIALFQSRCECGCDLRTDVPSADDREQEPPEAA